jgi:hypothetical protein
MFLIFQSTGLLPAAQVIINKTDKLAQEEP